MPSTLSSLEELFASLGRKLGQALDRDAELRALVSKALTALTGAPVTAPCEGEPEPVGEGEALVEAVAPLIAEAEQPVIAATAPARVDLASVELLTSLKQHFASAAPAPPVVAFAGSKHSGLESLEVIKQRLKLKIEAIELAHERATAREHGEAITTTGQWFREVIAEAKVKPNWYLWMCHPTHDAVPAEGWARLLPCGKVLLRALIVFDEVQNSAYADALLSPALHLLAEAQSAWRTACSAFYPEDADQKEIFEHLLAICGREGIYIAHYMMADDRADPSQWRDLSSRIEGCYDKLAKASSAQQERARLMSKIRFEAKALSRAPRNPDEPWKKIINAVGQLIDTGMPPSNAELRTLLLPHVDYLPPEMELPETFQRFLREVDIFLATQQRDSSASLAAEEPTAEVARAAKYLAGSDMVVLGGDCRVQSRRAMIAAFGLANLNWVETRAHESIAPFEAAIARENVKVVLLVIRWASHSYGDIKAFCETYGKPLVRLPGGYGINQVAHQICEQCTVDA